MFRTFRTPWARLCDGLFRAWLQHAVSRSPTVLPALRGQLVNGIVIACSAQIVKVGEIVRPTEGKARLVVTIAVKEDGRDEATFIRATLWDATAEEMAIRLHVHDEVYIEGRLRLAKWAIPDGTERSGLNASVWLCQPMGQIGKKAPKRPPTRRSWAQEDDLAKGAVHS